MFKIVTFATIQQKPAYPSKYPTVYWTNLCQIWVGMINLKLVLRSLKVLFQGNQLIMGPFADVAMNDLLLFANWLSTKIGRS